MLNITTSSQYRLYNAINIVVIVLSVWLFTCVCEDAKNMMVWPRDVALSQAWLYAAATCLDCIIAYLEYASYKYMVNYGSGSKVDAWIYKALVVLWSFLALSKLFVATVSAWRVITL